MRKKDTFSEIALRMSNLGQRSNLPSLYLQSICLFVYFAIIYLLFDLLRFVFVFADMAKGACGR